MSEQIDAANIRDANPNGSYHKLLHYRKSQAGQVPDLPFGNLFTVHSAHHEPRPQGAISARN
jgi:hypothetical protein